MSYPYTLLRLINLSQGSPQAIKVDDKIWIVYPEKKVAICWTNFDVIRDLTHTFTVQSFGQHTVDFQVFSTISGVTQPTGRLAYVDNKSHIHVFKNNYSWDIDTGEFNTTLKHSILTVCYVNMHYDRHCEAIMTPEEIFGYGIRAFITGHKWHKVVDNKILVDDKVVPHNPTTCFPMWDIQI